ncbi:PepSY-like domain-containing protein [Brumimicrobium mesophilum]|uniref:PepSY-like domain-containing protein n=1 Tax=Brumimicrobium mesophilum TaxID=392717 RepID=UPI000D143557|nr:PepSY-like domain-containing protein [Brumimicrobium mesophilum]
MDSKKIIGNAIITTALGIIVLRSKKVKLVYLDQLPSFIHEFVKLHFSTRRILKAVQHRKLFNGTYEVLLDGEIRLAFNKRGQLIEIEGNSKLPNSVIPSKILDFIAINYPDNVIIEWELEKKYQEIELDSGLELIFDLNGEFLGLDY